MDWPAFSPPPRERRFLPALAEAIAEWFPELNGRAFAVSDATITKENVPTLPLVMVALARSVGEQLAHNYSADFEIVDSFVVEFWLKPEIIKRANGSQTPFWTYYEYEDVRNTLLSNLSRWHMPGDYEHKKTPRIAFRTLHIAASPLAVTLTFGFIASMRWCADGDEHGEPFKISLRLCAPPSCVPETCYEEDINECQPCP